MEENRITEAGNEAVESKDLTLRQNKIRKMLLALAFVGAILIVGIVIANIIPNKNEQRAVSAVTELKTMLKDPDSLKIRGDILAFDSDSGYCVALMYSATNSYGGTVSNIAYFCELGYLGDEDTDIEDISSFTMRGRLIDARLVWKLFQVNGAGAITDGDLVSGSRIAKKVGCAYSDY